MLYEAYEKLIGAALEELSEAAGKMKIKTLPETSLPRPRFFKIGRRVIWPLDEGEREPAWYSASAGLDRYSLAARGLSSHICNQAGYQPRKIYQALAQIRAAIAWCVARAEGRKRAAEEILRQQQRFADALDAEAALAALKTGN